jgi:thiol-disulfide isomerase/thioredoxin
MADFDDALAEAQVKPMEMRFAALDGREVDLAKLRGKVVLIDFTAYTWCLACHAEDPYVRAAYDKYHEKGFEVIGLALELRKATEYLVAHVRDAGIAWPLYFNGKGLENEWAQKCGFIGVPQLFLLDKQGLLVTPKDGEARGKNLEPLVRNCLGLGHAPN